MSTSYLEQQRLSFQPSLPDILKNLQNIAWVEGPKKELPASLQKLFPQSDTKPLLLPAIQAAQTHTPLRVGVVLSGGQAPGGHNVIAGLFDALKKMNRESTLLGFLDGPKGIIENNYKELTSDLIDKYRNLGGFDLIGSGRTKIETEDQFKAAEKNARDLQLDGLVIIGGDDSNTNAAFLAEYFLQHGCKTTVVGVPKTIDGDLKNEEIEVSFGFDTAAKNYSETIGSIARDTLSAKKSYYFIKLMGRSASHITLECALQTQPNWTLISEETAANKQTLNEITSEICDLICQRAQQGKDYGIILIPEGIVEFIPEFKSLIQELNKLFASGKTELEELMENLSIDAKRCFISLPAEIRKQLLLERDPHGNVQVSKIETERLFIELVKQELKIRKKEGKYSGKFNAQPHFCGYEGRSCYPSNFDCQYCYALGHVAALLVDFKATGYISCVSNLTANPSEWTIKGLPITSLLNFEEREGKSKAVIEKALVNLKGKPFSSLQENRQKWALNDLYQYPGPIQFFGPQELTNSITKTLQLES